MESSWLIISAAMVFLMQAGFLCLETGKVRSKNSVNVAAKNVADFVIAAAIYWAFGYAIMFGDSYSGIFGTSDFFFGENADATRFSFFLFQLMFCGATATLLSGAVAERMSFPGYVITTIVLCSLIFPFVGHWVWYSSSDLSNHGWLKSLGFYDFAGATVVHSVGGWVALAAIIILGPRIGRFNSKKRLPQGSNIPMATLGVFLIWFGWFGFNGGSTLSFDDAVPLVLVNTCIGAIFGAIGGAVFYSFTYKKIDISMMLNGVIAGLVSVTAGANGFIPSESALAGLVAGVLFCLGCQLLDYLKLDDVLSVVPAHLIAGMWGTIAVALFCDPAAIGTGLSFTQQLKAQIIGITIIGMYSFGVSFVVLYLINRFYPLRVSRYSEMVGMNISEHGVTTELIDLLDSMKKQESQGKFSKPVKEEPFTEVGQIAKQYNKVIQRVNSEITTRDDAITAFKTSEMRKAAILESSMDSVITVTKDGHITEFNPAAEKIFGYSKKQALGIDFIDLIIPLKAREHALDSLLSGFTTSGVLIINRRNSIQLKRIDDDIFPAEVTITSSNKADVSNEFTLHIRDVSNRQKMQIQLKKLAFNDPLTGLHNRTFLLQALHRAVKNAENTKDDVVLFFLDLDRFKSINDTLGHKAGDALLCEVAKKLNSITREKDIIARWGGDEFIILMTGEFNDEILKEKAESILKVMRETVEINGRDIHLQTSIGISLRRPEDTEVTGELLIQYSDLAMYASKQKGRNQYRFFSTELAEQARTKFDYELALKVAVESEKELFILYQPQFDNHKNLVGMEALLRWKHKAEGVIPPSVFIPIAENSDLIIDIEEQTIRLVFAQLADWKKQQIDLVRVAINLSGKHLLHPYFMDFIEGNIAKYDIDPSLIEFEITEGVMLNDIDECVKVIRKLKDINISISVDDFGTGYSSLSYLKRLPLDILKIDRSFVMDATHDHDDREICATIINLAKSLGLSTIAEGVETKEQFELLKSMGTDCFQGYYFA
ncbi:MAG: ammonium transporter, partial [Pseudomonadota bacterium]